MTSLETQQANPHFTWAQSVGYSTGYAAARIQHEVFVGPLPAMAADDIREMRVATDEYAYGFRKGFDDYTTQNT